MMVPFVLNVGLQIDAVLSAGGTISASDLVVLCAGHNDIIRNLENEVVLENLSRHVMTFHANHAQDFLVGNLFNFPNKMLK